MPQANAGGLEHVTHPDGQLAILPAEVERGIGEARRTHAHLGIARKAEPFAGHHPQRAVGLAVVVLVVKQRDRIMPRLDVPEGERDAALARLRRRAECARHAAAAREAVFVRSHAGAHDALGAAQVGHRDRDRRPRRLRTGSRARRGGRHRASQRGAGRDQGKCRRPLQALGLSPRSVPQARSQKRK